MPEIKVEASLPAFIFYTVNFHSCISLLSLCTMFLIFSLSLYLSKLKVKLSF
jgi:hypothetical protein